MTRHGAAAATLGPSLHPTTLEALRGRLTRLQNEHRATIDALESSKAAQQGEIDRTKEENGRLRARRQQLQSKLAQIKESRDLFGTKTSGTGAGTGSTTSGGLGPQQHLQQEMEAARRESDELKVRSIQLAHELEELKDQVRTLDLQLPPPALHRAPPTTATTTTTTTTATTSCSNSTSSSTLLATSTTMGLEEAIGQATTQLGEAQQIRETYGRIVERLKGERVGFDKQIAALDRTLALKRRDLEQLLALSREAAKARDAAQDELGKRKAACQEDQARRDAALREKQQLIQQSLLRKRKEARRAAATAAAVAVAAAASTCDLEDGAADRDVDSPEWQPDKAEAATGEEEEDDDDDDDNDRECEELLAERRRVLAQLQQSGRRIRDVMGAGTVQGVVEKLAAQAETLESLGTASRENQARLERLEEERDRLRAVAQSRFAPQPPVSEEDEVVVQLTRDEERLAALQLQHQRQIKLLKGIDCSCQHLLHQLRGVVAVDSEEGEDGEEDEEEEEAAGSRPKEPGTAAGLLGLLNAIELGIQRMQRPSQLAE